jgi:hypothetical protein
MFKDEKEDIERSGIFDGHYDIIQFYYLALDGPFKTSEFRRGLLAILNKIEQWKTGISALVEAWKRCLDEARTDPGLGDWYFQNHLCHSSRTYRSSAHFSAYN